MSDASSPRFVAVPGSQRELPSGARRTGSIAPETPMQVSVYLRPNPATAAARASTSPEQYTLAGTSAPMSREEYAAAYGAAPEDIQAVERFAAEHSLRVVDADPARRVVVLEGPARALTNAFGVDLQQYEMDGQTFRGRSGSIWVPTELGPLVTGVFGLDNRPQARAHFQLAGVRVPATPGVAPGNIQAAAAPAVSYTPPRLASIYAFPTTTTGAGQTIGIIELGGGYTQSDLDTYFGQLGLATPTVISVPVDGANNTPAGDPNSADGEVALDIEVAGALAPAARIAVYFGPNTDQGFLDAITTAIHDTQNAPSVISISWGGPESSWTAQAQQAMDSAFQDAARLGVTVCCASGDQGAQDGVGDGLAHVDFPASSPFALGCGGTRLVATSATKPSETVWNDGTSSASGGGVSDTFALPSWQTNAGVPASINAGARVGRGVPDVAGDADPQTGYQVQVDGQSMVIGGTSAVAPLWSGLIALLNASLGRPVGYLNPVIYQQVPESAFGDVTIGNNNGYNAKAGWDACTGLGSPNGEALLSALRGHAQQPAPGSNGSTPQGA